jgi:hypothetical protein
MERPLTMLCIAGVLAGVAAEPLYADTEATCLQASAQYNRLPLDLLRAIRQEEAGRVGGWQVNADGSVDYGVMQINSRWLPILAAQGYTARVLTYDACASIAAGAWILVHALSDASAWNRSGIDGRVYWRAVGDYHSHTLRLNRAYAEQVWLRYRQQEESGVLP